MTGLGGAASEAIASSFLAASDPTWAQSVPEPQLVGLLNLASLLSSTIYISDIDVGDNANFFTSYRRGESLGLYARLREFAEMGLVRLLLRDQSFRLHSRIDVDCFYDVYRAWKEQDSVDAWIVKDFTEDRERYFRDLDSWATGRCVKRYPYKQVKQRFMQKLRGAVEEGTAPWIQLALNDLPPVVRRRYDDILKREWFSLTDLKTLFQSSGIRPNQRAMLYHGLMNQLTYSDYLGAALVGSDREGTPIEAEVWAEDDEWRHQLKAATLEAVLERAKAILDGPSLSVLAGLAPAEVARLREFGRSYFELLRLSEDEVYWSREHSSFGSQFVQAAVTYWSAICDYLATAYAHAVTRRTKLAVFLGVFPGSSMRVAESSFSFAVDASTGIAATAVSPPTAAALAAAGRLMRPVKLRFLFVTEMEELQRIRKVLPNRSWFRRSRPRVFQHFGSSPYPRLSR